MRQRAFFPRLDAAKIESLISAPPPATLHRFGTARADGLTTPASDLQYDEGKEERVAFARTQDCAYDRWAVPPATSTRRSLRHRHSHSMTLNS